MYNGRTVGVVIPAYNEADHVGEMIETMPAYVDRIYAVDDASPDETWDVIRDHAQRMNVAVADHGTTDGGDPSQRVVTIRHERNRGAGAAIKTGYRRALDDGMDVAATMDGDGQMEPDQLERIVSPVANDDVTYAKGNRLLSPSDYEEMSRWRLFRNVLLTLLTRASSGYWEVSDPQNGFTAISNEGLKALQFKRLYDEYGFLNHLLFALNVNRRRIADVSHRAVYGDETSAIRYSTFVPRVSALLLRTFFGRLTQSYLIRRFHPLVICYVLGGLVTLTGVAGVLYSMWSPAIDPLLGGMASVSVAAIGQLLLILGLWFDVTDNTGLVRTITRFDGPRADSGLRDGPPSSSIEMVGDGGRDTRVGPEADAFAERRGTGDQGASGSMEGAG